jgi:uncharacterized LabA/DUF88 family protein
MSEKRWMVFVDGENLTLRAQNLDKRGLLKPGSFFLRDVFVWTALAISPRSFLLSQEEFTTTVERKLEDLQTMPIRAYYYTNLVGDEEKVKETKEALWRIGFEPKVFKKPKRGVKAKGIDIALATDFLSNAFLDNYDVAFLFSGDGDYVPLVNEVKRLGKVVIVCFFSGNKSKSGLSPELKLASDGFLDIGYGFFRRWEEMNMEEH